MSVGHRQPIAVSDISIYICLIDIRIKSKEQLNERRAGLSTSSHRNAQLNQLNLVNFLYLGEANAFQEDLDSFLGLAEELKLKGLMGRTLKSDEKDEPMCEESKPFSKGAKFEVNADKERTNLKDTNEEEPRSVLLINNERTISIPNSVFGDLKELDEKVKLRMKKKAKTALLMEDL